MLDVKLVCIQEDKGGNIMALDGIDISRYQKGINLKAVPADFVIVKATQGTWFKSPEFETQCDGTIEAGKLLGIYHYAEGTNPEEEAKYFLNQVGSDRIKGALICLDWEGQDNKLFNASGDKEWVKKWCDYITVKTGVKPIVYVQASALYRLQGIGYEFWVAQYANNNVTGYQQHPWNEGKYSCLIRQYTSAGSLPGYSGRLDLDKFYGAKDDWNARVASGAVKTTATVEHDSPDASEPAKVEGPLVDILYDTMSGKYGDGDARKAALGNRYIEVQNTINHIASAKAADLAAEVKAGKYGNGDVRKKILGSRYEEVQKIINGENSKSEAVYYTVKSGDTLSAIASSKNTTVSAIMKLNPSIKDANKIYPNQKIRVK